MSETTALADAAGGAAGVGDRVRTQIDRAIKRNLKGLEFLTAPRAHVGAMASDQIARRGTMALNRYRPITDEVYRLPLLIVSPPSNRGYIFDLTAGQSFVEFMLARGYDVFLLDWLPPRGEEAAIAFEDYLLDFLPDCVARIAAITGQERLTLAGYCMGGTLATMYAALRPELVANLLCFTTPIDFTHMHMFQVWADRQHFDVDDLVRRLPIVPPEIMLGAFDMMRPANRTAGMLHLWTNMWDDDFVKSYRMFDRWSAETLPLPGAYFLQLVKKLMWENALVAGTMAVGGEAIDLKRLTMPILSILAAHDHIVAREAAAPFRTMTGSDDVEEIVSKGGHVSVVAGPGAVKRLWPQVDAWLGKRSV